MSQEFHNFNPGEKVIHPELGEGIIASPSANGFVTVFFRSHGERHVKIDSFQKRQDAFEQLIDFLHPASYAQIQRLQLAIEAESLPLMESASALTAAKVDLLPHQIVLVHRIANADPRRFLIADEVGLGKTIETALILRELASRGELQRAMMIVPAGLVENWRHELNDVFHLDFEVFGSEGDVTDRKTNAFAKHNRLIASIDTLKRHTRIKRIMEAPRWDLIVFDEAHHLSVYKEGNRTRKTQNYKLAETLKEHCRDMLLLSATPHQGDHFRFWMLIRLLNEELFADATDMVKHRYKLNAVVIRRTKADACTSDGGTLFARRIVHTEAFKLSPPEQEFYQELIKYLIDGYNLAAKSGNQGRGLGLVMTVFQKIAASSFAAIRSTLERRRLMLTIQEIIESDEVRDVNARNKAVEMAKRYIREIYHLGNDILGEAEAEQILVKSRVQLLKKRREAEELLESEDSFSDGEMQANQDEESVVFLTAMALPQERERINALLEKYPARIESKTAMLINALKQIWQSNPAEKIVVFATYLGTVEAIKEQLKVFFPENGIEVLKGGDHGSKTAAQKRFKRPDGPKLMVCTAAGREGINLQFAKVLFNYDLPWNPMDLEQRIGRIHRYGQNATAQVYNLVAGNTIEGQIYLLLENKLSEIAATLGKVDENGQVTEDLRGQVLGQLSSSLSYDKLYKEAISDPTLQRTKEELDVAIANASTARKVVFELFQDLDGFNLGDYKKFDDGGRSMARLVSFVSTVAPLCGYSFIKTSSNMVEIKNEGNGERYIFTDDREKAMADDRLQLFGMEHPLIVKLIGEAARLPLADRSLICNASGKVSGILTYWKVNIKTQSGKNAFQIMKIALDENGERNTSLEGELKFEEFASSGTPEQMALLKSLSNPMKAILYRAMDYSGIIPDDASYAVQPLAIIKVC